MKLTVEQLRNIIKEEIESQEPPRDVVRQILPLLTKDSSFDSFEKTTNGNDILTFWVSDYLYKWSMRRHAKTGSVKDNQRAFNEFIQKKIEKKLGLGYQSLGVDNNGYLSILVK